MGNLFKDALKNSTSLHKDKNGKWSTDPHDADIFRGIAAVITAIGAAIGTVIVSKKTMTISFFSPRIGKDYARGGIFGKRILVLGESHYCGTGCADCGECGKHPGRMRISPVCRI